MQTRRLRARRGFTLLEMILAMTLMLAFLGMTAELFRKQSDSVSSSSGRLDAQQNARFAMSMIERELRMAGVGVPNSQPLLVQASEMAITFNADLAARDTGDLSAVYINPNADSGAVNLLTPANKIILPTTTTNYPDTTYYLNATTASEAETISYWLSHDSTSSYSNEYVLYRRANAETPRVVARGIVYNGPGDSLFTFFKDSLGTKLKVDGAALPLIHTAAIHGSAADTGKSAVTDSITEVKVRLTSVYHDMRLVGQHRDTIARTVFSTIHLMNAGLIHQNTCGSKPLGVSPTATVVPAGVTVPSTYVTISWAASVDDGSGEKDVQRYALYRRPDSLATFDGVEPFASVPASALSNYSFNDFNLASGQKWIYGVTAQDCTPSSSPMGSTSSVTIP